MTALELVTFARGLLEVVGGGLLGLVAGVVLGVVLIWRRRGAR